MADEKLSPEQQLLKLIEDSKKVQFKSDSADLAATTPTQAAKPLDSQPLGAGKKFLKPKNLQGAFLGRWSFFKRTTTKKIKKSKPKLPSLAIINGLLFLTMLGVMGYVGFEAFLLMKNRGNSVNFLFQKEKAPVSTETKSSLLKDSDYYLQKVNARDIFKEGQVSAPKHDTEKKKESSAQDNALLSGFSLVGISWSANPDVIIEDKAKQKTYFVKRGQEVGDGVRIEAVFKDHVILSYDGQEFELR